MRNVGLEPVLAPYAAFVGPDNIMPPGSLEECLGYGKEFKFWDWGGY